MRVAWVLIADYLRQLDTGLYKDRPEIISKSPNRMVESLRAGRFAAAHSIPAYEEFREWAWVAESLTEGIGWAVRNPAMAVRRLQDAQRHIEATYAPEAIANAWERTIRSG